MSIRFGLLALLGERPMYGYQLRAEFEERTGGTWPLNVGQVYSTLQRLERDGLVTAAEGEGAVPRASGEERRHYELTEAGREKLERWFALPTEQPRGHSELVIKVVMASALPWVDTQAVIDSQRVACMRALQAYTHARAGVAGGGTVGLVVDSVIFRAEAELRWLDHCQARLARIDDAGKSGRSGRAQ